MWRRILLGVGILLPLLGLVLFLWRTGAFQAMRSVEEFRAYIERFGIWAYLIFWLIQFISVVVAPIPGNVVTVVGAVAFGFWWGTLLSVTANFCASILVFVLVRRFGQNFARRLAGKHMTRYHELFTRKRDSFLFLTILLPFFPDDVICMLAGLTEIPFTRFLIILITAKPWGLIVSSAAGAIGTQMPLPVLIIFGILCILLFVFGLKYGDRVEEWMRLRIGKFNGSKTRDSVQEE